MRADPGIYTIGSGKAHTMSEFAVSIVRRSLLLILLFSTIGLLNGCSDPEPKPVRGDPRAKSYPLYSIDMDPQREMPFAPAQPFRLEFGRGNSRDGLETIAIDEQGQVVLYRMKEETEGGAKRHAWETAALSIDADAVQRIAKLIEDLDLLQMNLAYDAKVDDGSQWAFWLVQGDRQKSIFFNNYFPEFIQDFAVALDRELEQAGAGNVEWNPVPPEQAREHDKDLWEVVER